jgi:hypothetical protein
VGSKLNLVHFLIDARVYLPNEILKGVEVWEKNVDGRDDAVAREVMAVTTKSPAKAFAARLSGRLATALGPKLSALARAEEFQRPLRQRVRLVMAFC